MFAHIRASSRGTLVCTRRWLGWSSRVRFPERNTDESLSNVSLPSAAGYSAARPVVKSSCASSCSVGRSPRGNRPRDSVAAPTTRRPRHSPPENDGRMFRTCRRSLQTNDDRSASSYAESAPPPSDAHAASAASRPDSIA